MNKPNDSNTNKFRLEDESVYEFELISTTDSIESKMDERLADNQFRLDNLNSEIDRLTSHTTQTDIYVSVASGFITGLIDMLYVGEIDIDMLNGVDFDNRSEGAKSINRFIMEFAEKNGWNGSKLADDKSKLSCAIRFCEDKFKLDQDNYRGFSSSKLHHLEDLAHHPTPAGLVSAVIVTFFRVGIFADKDGNIKFMPLKTSKKNLLITWAPIIISGILYWISCWAIRKYSDRELSEMPKWKRVLIKLFCGSPIFIAIGKVAINWAGHLVSDMGGSKNSPDKGAGIPGLYISLLKELSMIPPLNKTSLPKDISDLYSKKNVDFRSELLPISDSLGKQVIPVFLNELIISTFYFVSQLKNQYTDCGGWSNIKWKETIPYGNRTIARMRTISSGVFTAVDMADAAIRAYAKSGGELATLFMQMALRINIVGLGKLTVNFGNDFAAMGSRKDKMRDIRLNVMAERLYLTHAKLYLREKDIWVSANESQLSVNEFQTNVIKAVAITNTLIQDSCNEFEKFKTNLEILSKSNNTLKTELSSLL